MFRLLMLAFIVVPIVEIWVLLQVGDVVGGWETFSLVILVSAIGAWMVRREGFGLLMRVQRRLAAGEIPSKELVDGLLVAAAGALLLTPGFITDGIGLLAIFPPTRAVIRTYLMHRYGGRVVTSGPGFTPGGFGPGAGQGPTGGRRGPIIDVGEADYDRTDGTDEPPELGDASGGPR